jgi:glycosyltransferase involved in cell wall biosynthesis
MVRILHLVKTSEGATWAVRQTRELRKLGFDVHVAVPEGGPRIVEYRQAGVTVHQGQWSLPVRQPHRWPAMFARFRSLIEDVDPDIIHSHFVGTTLTMRLALGRRDPRPRVFQVPGTLHLEHPLIRVLEIRSAGRQDSWIGCCKWICQRYRESGIAPDRVFLSRYGVDLAEIHAAAPGTLRHELDLAPGQQVIGMVAYMYAPRRLLGQSRGLKGHEDLIDAIALLRAQGRDVIGVFAGGAWNGRVDYESRVCAYARRRLGEHAHFLGTRFDVPDLYADFDVAVHPSHSEAIGGAVESLMLAVPTVTTDVGGFPDVVKPGQTGWLVPAKSPASLAEAIAEALDDPQRANELARKGQVLARDILDIRRNAKEVAAAYEQILSRTGGGS